jgi:hypothetical protein
MEEVLLMDAVVLVVVEERQIYVLVVRHLQIEKLLLVVVAVPDIAIIIVLVTTEVREEMPLEDPGYQGGAISLATVDKEVRSLRVEQAQVLELQLVA